ncbi:MAG: Asp-tRNA(Asn)/Glu-tRNA(Gln) amidotransferase subunit GatA [Bacillota bacterium]
MEIWELSAKDIHEKVKSKEISALEVAESYFARTAQVEPKICAYLELMEPEALAQAAKVDAAIARGEDPGILAGLTVAVKDNINVKGVKCTCGSKILEGYVSPYDATAIKRLRDQGAVITGKTNLDEFAMGSSTENSAFMTTRNPWDVERVPGGSSGGSAAAVAAGMAALGLGSDTGGSVRQPAAFTGTYGMMPTYGRVSRYGLVAFGSSLDQIGPFGNSVWDCAALLSAMAGHDPYDATSAARPSVQFTSRLGHPVKGMRAGVPRELLGLGVSSGVREAFDRALAVLSGLGVEIEETTLPSVGHALDVYYIVAPSEASSNLARFDGVRYGLSLRDGDLQDMYLDTRGKGFGKEVRRRIMLGTFALSAGYYDAYYLRAAKIRTLLRREFEAAFSKFDVLLSPTTPTVAFKAGEKVDDPLAMYLADVLTVPVNLTGIPALSMPCGLAEAEPGSGHALPCGLQIMGRPFDEESVFQVGYALEAEIGEQLRQRTAEMRVALLAAKECDPVVS